MRGILYGRVSLADDSQTTDNQMLELERWAAIHPGSIVDRITDQASSRDRRPGHDKALEMLRTRKADTLVFWSLDRWGRSMWELVTELHEAIQRNWTFISLKEGISLDTAGGRLYANMLAAFAQFERDRISERTKAGLARTRASGTQLGRPRVFHQPDCAAARHRACDCGVHKKRRVKV